MALSIGTVSSGGSIGAVASLTVSHTAVAGASLLIFVVTKNQANTALTFNGTRVQRPIRIDDNTDSLFFTVGLMRVPPPGTFDIVATPGSSAIMALGAVNIAHGGAVLLMQTCGIVQTTSLTQKSAVDRLVLDMVAQDGEATFTPTAGQTELFDLGARGANTLSLAVSSKPGAAPSVTMGQTPSAGNVGLYTALDLAELVA